MIPHIIKHNTLNGEPITPANGRKFTLDELQNIVGGDIEYTRIPTGGRMMIMNEDGKRLGLPFNQLASFILGQPVVGDVLVCETTDID